MNPVIAIVGLRYGQPQHVEDKCKRLADLKFVGGEGDKAIMPKCDHIVLMTRFLRHGWTVAAYHQFPRSRVHTHPGGISSLAVRIKQISEAFHENKTEPLMKSWK
jgi:hypothetical protein